MSERTRLPAEDHEHRPIERPRPHQYEAAVRPEWRSLLSLQGTAGNRAVTGLVNRLSLQRNAKFDTAAAGVDQVGAPAEMGLPKELVDGMDAAWSASFPSGTSQEQGGILVKTKDGKYEWRAGKAGESGSWSPNVDSLKEGETLVAMGHTHPYDKTEGGFTGVSLSGEDIGYLVYQPVPIMFVQAGKKKFAVVQTKEFEKLVAAANTDEKKKTLYDAIVLAWKKAFDAAKGAKQGFVAAVEAAVKAVCDAYQLSYYAGEADTIKKQEVKAHVEAPVKAASVKEAAAEATHAPKVGAAP